MKYIGAFILFVSYTGLLFAETQETILERIDSILAQTSGKREAAEGSLVCGATGANAGNRAFLCEASSQVSKWQLVDLFHESGYNIDASLEIRRFNSESASLRAQEIALIRFGNSKGGYPHGSISWCYIDVIWHEDLLILLSYGCHVSLKWVKSIRLIRNDLLANASAWPNLSVVGILGGHSGDCFLMDQYGAKVDVPFKIRFKRFVEVVNVDSTDVLNVRYKPSPDSHLLGSIHPGTKCISLILKTLQLRGRIFFIRNASGTLLYTSIPKTPATLKI